MDSTQPGLKIMSTRKMASADNTISMLDVQHLTQTIWGVGMEEVGVVVQRGIINKYTRTTPSIKEQLN